MGEKKQLGIYFGQDSVYFAEVSSGRIAQSFVLPLTQDDFNELETSQLLSPSHNLADKINVCLAEHQITTKDANLSLPGKDIIFRSFIVPWMQPNELDGVIQFEVNKYIPFRIEELRHVYHWSPVNIGGMKKIQVIFVAIRYSTLQKYENLFHKIGISINLTEPSVNSLLKILITKNKVTAEKTVALIECDGENGKITVVDKGIPLFVRDFHVAVSSGTEKADTVQKFINETRVSLDYFSRQDNSIPVKEAVLISSAEEGPLQNALTTDLGIAVRSCQSRTIFDDQIIENLSYLNAVGTCLDVNLPAVFNLAIKEIDIKNDEDIKFEFGAIKPPNYKITAILGIIALALCILVKISQRIPLEKARADIRLLNQTLGSSSSLTVDNLEKKKKDAEDTLAGLERVPIKSNVYSFINAIPSALPNKGVWLTSIAVDYETGRSLDINQEKEKAYVPNISIAGYVYDESGANQISLISEYLQNLKTSPKLTSYFQPNAIYREDMTSRELNGRKVTAFSIKMKK
ncbi:MAG: pilus assembly protein PilM [Candidatus Omnitrophica bacterium]|nr:pilus assembly protein PilM [Candidatus Omnitrophota bacterium]